SKPLYHAKPLVAQNLRRFIDSTQAPTSVGTFLAQKPPRSLRIEERVAPGASANHTACTLICSDTPCECHDDSKARLTAYGLTVFATCRALWQASSSGERAPAHFR